MTFSLCHSAPHNVTSVGRIPQNPKNLLLRETFASNAVSVIRFPSRSLDSNFKKMLLNLTRRSNFFEFVEEVIPDYRCPIAVNLQRTIFTCSVSVRSRSIPQATPRSILHSYTSSFTSHFSLQLREDHDDHKHRFAHRRRCVNVLCETGELDVMLLKEIPQFSEIQKASCNSIELDAHDGLDLIPSNVVFESLEFGAILVLSALPSLDVDFEFIGWMICLNPALQPMLLSLQAVTLIRLSLS